MEKIIVANLKMNQTSIEVNDYLEKIKNTLNSKRIIICPTYIYIPYFIQKKYDVGVQNIADKEQGAYTGEVSASQVSSMGIKYAIVGHSERRTYFHETDSIINNKIKMGLKSKLTLIVCIGETKEEKDMLKTDRILKRQINGALKQIDKKDLKDIIIAYEPIWSIGTGDVPKNKDIQGIVKYIKGVVKCLYNDDIDIPVLYGGSVNEKNIEKLNEIDGLLGYLVGGASLKPDKMIEMKRAVID